MSSNTDYLSPKRATQEFPGVLNENTMAAWRHAGSHPELPFTKVGRKVFYRRGDIIAFLHSNIVGAIAKEA